MTFIAKQAWAIAKTPTNGYFAQKKFMGRSIKVGRLVIPANMRKAVGLKPGDKVILVAGDDGLRVLTVEQAVREVRQWVRTFVPPERSLVDELLQERRQEAESDRSGS